MGIADKLGAKTRGLGMGDPAGNKPASSGATANAATAARTPRTGPGQLLAVRGMMGDAQAEVDKLRAQLQAFEGSVPAKALNAASVGVSVYANRHADEFATQEFLDLLEEVEKAGRNVQPILVRRVKGRGATEYEVIYGHRRLRACQDLKLPVWAIVAEATDEELFLAMDMENRQRKNPSPFELGDSYRRALENGLFSSLRDLAKKIHADHSLTAKAYGIATLPPEVLAAFPSPTDIQYRWGKQLSDALQKDPEGVIKRATAIKAARATKAQTASQVLAGLLAQSAPATPQAIELKTTANGPALGRLVCDAKGGVSVTLAPGAVSADRVTALQTLLVDFLKPPRS